MKTITLIVNNKEQPIQLADLTDDFWKYGVKYIDNSINKKTYSKSLIKHIKNADCNTKKDNKQ